MGTNPIRLLSSYKEKLVTHTCRRPPSEDMHIEGSWGRRPEADKGRDWSYVAKSPGMPRTAESLKKKRRILPETVERA